MNAYGNANRPIKQSVKKNYFKDCLERLLLLRLKQELDIKTY